MMQPAGSAEADVPADQVDALHAPPGVQPSLSVNWLRAGSLVEPPLDMFAGCCEQRPDELFDLGEARPHRAITGTTQVIEQRRVLGHPRSLPKTQQRLESAPDRDAAPGQSPLPL
jgi:hypothetical protein